jgi:xanthine/CO dehydrogenase XdhC/CoxF family maturation factor
VSELSQILSTIRDTPDTAWALATVVGVSGSTYRLPGAKQLLRADGTSVGTVSGGCLDADLVRIVGEVIGSQSAQFVTYDLSADDDEVWGFGLGCNGVTEVLVEPAVTAAPFLNQLAAARHEAESLAAVTLTSGPSIGARLVVREMGESSGTLGLPELERAGIEAALAALDTGRHSRVVLSDEVRAFVEVQVPAPHLLICGAGHDAIPLVRYGTELGWRVTVVDDRAAYLTRDRFRQASALQLGQPKDLQDLVVLDGRSDAIVMTHNYLRDVEYLRQLINSPVRYIGMLGPRARTDRMIKELQRDGLSMQEEALRRLYAPAGLDLGAEGPDQIAWSILAEVQAVARGRNGAPLRDRKGGIHQGLTEGRDE